MEKSIREFPDQFNYVPEIFNRDKLVACKKVIIAGMGGSHLAADIIKSREPNLPIIVHSDYGLPYVPKTEIGETLVIASSFSGNTEETLDSLATAIRNGHPCAAMGSGGLLIDHAKEIGIPYIVLPNEGIQPRMALGYGAIAISALLGRSNFLEELKTLSGALKMDEAEKEGKYLAERLKNRIPVFYSSRINGSIAAIWKIKINETAKMPAFANVFPEMNHNEMAGYDTGEASGHLRDQFITVFFEDKNDDLRILKRVNKSVELFERHGIAVLKVALSGEGFNKIFNSLAVADWTALNLALSRSVEPNEVKIVEEFKREIL